MNTTASAFQEGDLVKMVPYGIMGIVKSIAGSFVYVNLPEGLIIPVACQELAMATSADFAIGLGSTTAA